MVDKELTEAEEVLLKFARDFFKFLCDDPQIRYGLQKTVENINDNFLYVKRNLT